MKFNNLKYRLLTLLSFIALIMTSCHDDFTEAAPGVSEAPEYSGDVLNLTMTLDYMGGTRAESSNLTALKLETLENYIDPEKTRVLFFDEGDKFLFESRSRWVRQLDATTDHIIWSVSVPFYTYGNDKEDIYQWEWEKIRAKLTAPGSHFKIVIMANFPAYQYYPDLTDSELGEYWFDNSGPKWGRKNSVVYEGSDKDEKDIFDLHHTQFDPIYYNKSIEANGGGSAYDFIMGGTWGEGTSLLSATSSWLDYDNDDTIRDPYGWDFRYNRLPSEEEPIPMYGVQQFETLTDWVEGTSIELNRPSDNPISLLRSVVKIDVSLPKDFADDLVMFYGNWFARSLPMDVWTPTDKIWVDDSMHGNVSNWADNAGMCEWGKIWKHKYRSSDSYPGVICSSERNAGIDEYKKIIMWQYGLWRVVKGWSFDRSGTTGLNTYFDNTLGYGSISRENADKEFPHIFNTCIQRIQRVMIRKTYTEGDFDHYVMYVGERNVNDPTNMTNLPNTGSGNSPVLYFSIIKGDIVDLNPAIAADKYIMDLNPHAKKKYTGGSIYSFPMVDFAHGANVYNCTREGVLIDITPTGFPDGYSVMGPANSPRCVGANGGASNGTGMGEYIRRVAGNNNSDRTYFRPTDPGTVYTGADVPVPLLRNHVYKMQVTGTRTRGDGSLDLNFNSEFKAAPTINFKNR